MKQALVILIIVALACCSTQMKPRPGETPQPPAPAPSQPPAAAPTLGGETFIGTIVGYRMGGSMARPYVRSRIKGEDGQVVEFNLRKTTAVTDPAGTPIGFMKRYKNGRRVEIKFVVKDGVNEAVAWHYLD